MRRIRRASSGGFGSRKRQLGVRGSLAILILASMITAGSALAAASTLKVKGPSKPVNAGKRYAVTASGNASGGATTLRTLEGRASCLATYMQESSTYERNGEKAAVSGHFTKVFHYENNGSGKKTFCAYLTDQSGSVTYAHASTHWMNK